MSIEWITFLMLTSLIGIIMLGFPIGFSMAGVATFFGIFFIGPQVSNLFMLRMYYYLSDYADCDSAVYFSGGRHRKIGNCHKAL